MSRSRPAVVAVLGARIAYGAALLAAPTRITRRWLGPGREGAAAQVALRGLAATLASRRGLPTGSPAATPAVAGTSAAITAALLAGT